MYTWSQVPAAFFAVTSILSPGVAAATTEPLSGQVTNSRNAGPPGPPPTGRAPLAMRALIATSPLSPPAATWTVPVPTIPASPPEPAAPPLPPMAGNRPLTPLAPFPRLRSDFRVTVAVRRLACVCPPGCARSRQRGVGSPGRKDGRMKFGLRIDDFNWPGGDREMGARLADAGRRAEEAGFDSIWVWDHFVQRRKWEDPHPEGWMALAHLAGLTQRIMLGTHVTGVTYRAPAILVKQATTLDVLSGGRAYLGIGAACFTRMRPSAYRFRCSANASSCSRRRSRSRFARGPGRPA